MKISILIVTRKWKPDSNTFNYINQVKNRNLDFEVLIAEGNNPSSQRNLLAEKSNGELILFLDDDSVPAEDLLERYRETLEAYPEAKIIGGPSLLIKKDQSLSPLSNIFFSSSFGIGPVRNRYNSIGATRKATEKDLILCNLLIKRDFFLKTKGFNQEIYPGEENEFLNNLDEDVEILYNPDAIVYREPRRSFVLFLEQMFSYGKGRGKHLKLNSFCEFLFLIPLFFSLYIFNLPLIKNQSFAWYAPVGIHFLLSVITLIIHGVKDLSIRQRLLLPFFFFLGHFSYGVGVMAGIVKHRLLSVIILKKRNKEQIKIYNLKIFKKYSN
jgi:succinoglycan biosynthesis protein ExoA